MTDSPDPEPELTPREHALAEQLRLDKPLPAAGFRGALSRHLEDRNPGYGTRPPRLRLIASGYLAGGALLLALGLLQATGAL
jgi:hypothetical protein